MAFVFSVLAFAYATSVAGEIGKLAMLIVIPVALLISYLLARRGLL